VRGVATLLLLIALAACGRYGPPVRVSAADSEPAPTAAPAPMESLEESAEDGQEIEP
jgi:predicted small lipoprotein YifL